MENPEIEVEQGRRSSREFDLALRPAPTQSGDDSTETVDVSGEVEEVSDAGATHGTENAEASRAESNDGLDTTDVPTATDGVPASDEPDCETQLREARDRISQLEEDLRDCERRAAWTGVSMADLPDDRQLAAVKEVSKAHYDVHVLHQQINVNSTQFIKLQKEKELLAQNLVDCRRHGRDLQEQRDRYLKLLRTYNG